MRIHYTIIPLNFNYNEKYRILEPLNGQVKPHGFWYSNYNHKIKNINPVYKNMYDFIGGFNKLSKIIISKDEGYEVKIINEFTKNLNKKDYDKILLIENEKELIEFENKYITKPITGLKYCFYKLLGYKTKKLWYNLNWEQIKKDYGGIEIHPYITSRRFKSEWYYPWDCSSGCIWNLKCIKVTPLKEDFIY